MWALGVIVYFLLLGSSPFSANAETLKQLYKNITSVKYSFPKDNTLSENAKDFIKSILVKDENKRLGIKEIMAHPWFHQNKIPKNIPISFLKEPPPEDFIKGFPITNKNPTPKKARVESPLNQTNNHHHSTLPALKPAHSHGKLNIHSIKSVKVEPSPLSAGRSKKQALATSQTVKQLTTKFAIQKIISHDVDAQEESKDPHHGGSSPALLHKNTRNIKLQPIKSLQKIKT